MGGGRCQHALNVDVRQQLQWVLDGKLICTADSLGSNSRGNRGTGGDSQAVTARPVPSCFPLSLLSPSVSCCRLRSDAERVRRFAFRHSAIADDWARRGGVQGQKAGSDSRWMPS